MTAARPYHHGNLRTALIERAEALIEEQGVSALSLRELAREVGVSHAAPRRHFPDRQALLDALAVAGFDQLGAAITVAVTAAGDEFSARLHAMARAYVGFATQHAALLELMYAGKHRADADAVRAAADAAFATPMAVMGEGSPDGGPGRAGLTAFATFHGLAALANGGMLDTSDLERTVAETVEQLLHGLAP